MNCEHARELFAAELLGELDEDGRRALAAHHETCPTCRADAASDRTLWRQLGTLSTPAWSDVARAHSLEALREATRTVNPPVRRGRPWLVAASIAAAFLLGMSAPAPWRAQQPPVAVDVASDSLPRWVLLFTEPRHDALAADRAGMQVQAMVEWIDTIAERDRFISGEKLAEGRGTVLTGSSEGEYAPAEHVTGFIIVRAGSEAEALAVARQSPVLDFGGTVLVLPVDPL